MNNQMEYSKWQSGLLVALRFLIGWHLLFEGLYKLINPAWSSVAFLLESKWIFSGIGIAVLVGILTLIKTVLVKTRSQVDSSEKKTSLRK